ncbi:hypothetical protein Pla52o_20960 [Novipirellula galeiformis]|uniref:Uncharacterized protein n=1 Tax=Novipirellula galeiformis TaxID=2528004 RepID=A0A5C6CIN7_9BACT|nr:hypothetical protein [Novipirellula galeiformis]TWU24172.1 hypothetical protein Pla52o_20960 [Novipirellula galeiformis]
MSRFLATLGVAGIFVALSSTVGVADEPVKGDGQVSPTDDRAERLATYLSGAKFVGKFTVDGKEDALPKTEEYTISKCEKLAEKNMYRLTARIKYGDVDSEIPMDLPILFAGNTPVITLHSFGIPGMGTFDARVLIHDGRYSGTWQHDQVGGHLFGKILKE